jgi:hypothetical protein
MTYRRTEMRNDAAARGWNLKKWFLIAGVNYHAAQKFMKGESGSPAMAEALTKALDKPQGFYQVRDKREAVA